MRRLSVPVCDRLRGCGVRCGELRGFWGELVVRSPDAHGEWYLGGHWAAGPADALRWMVDRAGRLADALDPVPRGGPFPPAVLESAGEGYDPAAVFREWVADAGYQRVQQRALRGGRPVSVNSRGPDVVTGQGEVEVLYSLSCRPVVVPSVVAQPVLPERSSASRRSSVHCQLASESTGVWENPVAASRLM